MEVQFYASLINIEQVVEITTKNAFQNCDGICQDINVA